MENENPSVQLRREGPVAGLTSNRSLQNVSDATPHPEMGKGKSLSGNTFLANYGRGGYNKDNQEQNK
jgi:hypothetical protein